MRTFDDTTGRLLKAKIENSISLAYTRYDYANTGNAVTSYSTIIDVNGDNSINTSDEVATESVFDGAGRLLKTRSANPNSTGGYTGKKVEYDILGRAYRETVPTEMNSSWNPAGDDYRSNTWLWNTREFDWKGRVTRTIPSDSTGSDGKDTLMSYEGCGCAGGMITTIQGPVTTAKDVGGTLQTTKRRVQKVYADILGRTAKTEVWDLDGAGSTPYSTTVTTFNGRDQATLVREYSGGTSSGTYQDTTISYDGHGRLKELHKPEWFDGSTLKYTTTAYNADDTPATVTDPRGTVTTYSYGNTTIAEKRAVLLGISYTVPSGSGIPVPGNVAFEYDAAGNRTKMTDDTGELIYAYDELSRLKTETKDFADTLSQSTYALSYQYTLTGGLKTITDPFSDSITYAHDGVGRTTGVTGSSFGGITNYASAVNYRAFGAAKSMIIETATDTTITQNFDNALRLTDYTAVSTANASDTINKDYTYANDGSLLQAEDDRHSIYSQTYSYDFASRVVNNRIGELSGTEKYKQTVGYDAFGNITSRSTWNDGTSGPSYTAGFTNNRKTSGGFQSSVDTFDVAGNITQNQIYGGMTNKRKWTFDAAGRISNWMETLPEAGSYLFDQGADTTYDGDGRSVKKIDKHRVYNNQNDGYVTDTKYKIYSSVTGAEITELNGSGDKVKTSVYLHGKVIAQQNNLSTDTVTFKFGDPIVGTQDTTDKDGVITPNDADLTQREPLGASIPTTEAEQTAMPNYGKGGHWRNPETGLELNGAPVSWSFLKNHLASFGIPVHGNSIIRTQVGGITYENDKGKLVTESEVTGYDVVNVGDGLWQFSIRTTALDASVQNVNSCTLEVLITNNKILSEKQLETFKEEFRRIYATAGIDVNFVSIGGDYWLSIVPKGNDYNPDKPRAIGATPLSADGRSVEPRGRVYLDRLIEFARGGSAIPLLFDIDRDEHIAIGLARAGSHETGHWASQQNTDSSLFNGVMRNEFNGADWYGQDDSGYIDKMWSFDSDQRRRLRQRICPKPERIQFNRRTEVDF